MSTRFSSWFIRERPRTATIRAQEYCDLYRLDKDNFDRVIQHYPDFAERINELAEKRKAEIEEIQQWKESEIPEEIEDIQAEHTGSAVSLRWNWVRDLRHYEVIKRISSTGKWVYVEKNALEPNISDPTPNPDASTMYRIRAIKSSGPGGWSSPVVIEAAPEEPET